MKILLINYRYFVSGGPERYLFNVKDLLEKSGHEVIPFSVKSKLNKTSEYEEYFANPLGGQDFAYFDKARITPYFILDVIGRLFYSFHVKRQLKRLIADTKPDAAYILHHYNKLSPSVIDACKDEGLPVYVRLSDFFLMCPQALFLRNDRPCEKCLSNGLHHALLGRCVKGSLLGSALKVVALYFHRNILSVYDRVDGFVCTTKFMKKKMIRAGFDESVLHVIPTFSLNTKIEQDVTVISPYKNARYILYFGRFAVEKGVDLLVDAYLKSSLPDQGIKLLLVGGERSELEQVIQRATSTEMFNKNIEVLGFKKGSDLSSLIASSVFVVVPSRCYENMPNTVIEAYSHGKAVIAMNIGSMPEIVKDGVTGLLFEKENCVDLKDKINSLIEDQALLDELSDNAGQFCMDFMDADKHLQKLTHLLNHN